MTTFVFDGSITGIFTTVFDFYVRKPGQIRLVSKKNYQPEMLVETYEVLSDEAKAFRVLKGIRSKCSRDSVVKFYKAYLGDTDEIFQSMFEFCCYVLDNPAGVDKNFGHPAIMELTKMEKSVNRERHRMKAFIRFRETRGDFFYAAVEPDFNVLPLVVSFFKNRYADQKWIIYDLRRKYGFYYDLKTVEEIKMEFLPEIRSQSELSLEVFDPKEELYSLLWKDYFKSTNIPARKNMKLHIQHVPRRYWKYLTEKN